MIQSYGTRSPYSIWLPGTPYTLKPVAIELHGIAYALQPFTIQLYGMPYALFRIMLDIMRNSYMPYPTLYIATWYAPHTGPFYYMLVYTAT